MKEGPLEALWPLSPLQEGILFHALRQPAAGLYVEQAVATLEGPLDRRALAQAWDTVFARHGALRAAFLWEEAAKPVQVVLRRVTLPWVDEDWRSLPACRHGELFAARLEEDRRRGFDPRQAPLARFRLMRLGEGRHRLLWTFHHLLLDGWSLYLVLAEVLACYRALVLGEAASLPARRSYGDFLQWLRSRGSQDERAYWREALGSKLPPALRLPHPGPTPSQGERSIEETLPPPLAAQLEAGARHLGVTLNLLFEAAWGLLLCRYGGQRRAVFGTVVSGRPPELPGVEGMVGLFVNTVPVAVELPRGEGRAAFLARLRSAGARRRGFEQSPLQEIPRWLELPPGQELFQSLLAFESYPRQADLRRPVAGLRLLEIDTHERAGYPLSLMVIPGEPPTLRLSFDGGLLAQRDAHRLLAHLRQLLEQLSALDDSSVERPVDEISVLTAAERHQLLHEGSGRGATAPGFHVLERLALWAGQRPDSPALESASGATTYGRLEEATRRLAEALLDRGVRTGTPVGVLLPRGRRQVTALLSTFKAGGVYVPLDPAFPAERLRSMIEDAGIRFFLVGPGGEELLSSLALAKPWGSLLVGPGDVASPDWSGVPARAFAPPAPELPAWIIFTSGSTGQPKGVLTSHAGVAPLVRDLVRTFGAGPGDRVLQLAAPTFDASLWDVFLALGCGATLCIETPEGLQQAGGVTQLLAGRKISHATLPPSLLATAERGSAPRWPRVLVSAVEACPASVVETWAPGRRFFNGYGPTEATIAATLAEIAAAGGEPSIGRAFGAVATYVLDGELRPVAAGLPGELFLGGAALALGYLHRAALTAESFLPNPFAATAGDRLYRTGDRVRHGTGGGLDFLGRVDDQLKVRGFRVEPGEIETRLRGRQEVSQAAVVLRPGKDGEKVLVAYVTGHGGALPDGPALRAALRRMLPAYMVPAFVLPLAAFPLTPNLKIDRDALTDPTRFDPVPADLAGAAPPSLSGDSLSPLEARLAALWAEVLNVPLPDPGDDFFELGGDSIRSLQLAGRLRREGFAVSPTALFEHSTLRQLAATLEPREKVAVEAATTGPVPLSAIQRWFFDADPHHPEQWNMAAVLVPRQGPAAASLDGAALAAAAQRLPRLHDALRLRFHRQGEAWRAELTEEILVPVSEIDLQDLPAEALAPALASLKAGLQASLDLQAGPLFRLALIHGPGERRSRLLAVAHHLVVDAYSWRILLEDLQEAYLAVIAGQEPATPSATTPYATWARVTAEAPRETAEEPAPSAANLASEPDLEPRLEGTVQVQRHSLGAALTRELSEALPAAARTRLDDLLLTAVARAIARQLPALPLRLHAESFGRDEAPAGLDLSRTVGWFTRLRGLDLSELATDESPEGWLRAVKEGLRQPLPSPDLAPASVPISFNFLGAADPTTGSQGLFDFLDEDAGPLRHPRERRRYVLEINAFQLPDELKQPHELQQSEELQLAVAYSPEIHGPNAMAALLAAVAREAKALLHRLRKEPAQGWVVEDFPQLRSSREDFRQILAALPTPPEDLYGLAPLQTGMLFHALTDPGGGAYIEQTSCRIDGPLEAADLKRAWQGAVDRHPVLRSGFLHEGLSQPVQVVVAAAEVAWLELDWRHLPAAEQEARFQALQEEEQRQGFALAEPPLLRLTLIRTAEASHLFLWSHHHLVLDGWSGGLLLQEVFGLYRGEDLSAAAPPPYRRFIAWLQEQDAQAAQEHWRQDLPARIPASALPPSRQPRPGVREIAAVLKPQEWAELRRLSQATGLTLNTFTQGALALLLAAWSGDEQTLFGTVVAGRPPELAGSEAMIGLFVNTLAVAVAVEPATNTEDWLREIQRRQAARTTHGAFSLDTVRRWAGLPADRPLFEALLVFENYPLETALEKAAEGLILRDAHFQDRTGSPLTVTALPTEHFELRVLYEGLTVDETTARRALGALIGLLTSLRRGFRMPVAAHSVLGPAQSHQLIWEWNHGRRSGATTVLEAIERRVRAAPEAIAIEDPQGRLSYGELWQQASIVAGTLAARGLGPGSVVALELRPSRQAAAAKLGVLLTGAAYLPLDPAAAPVRRERICQEAGAALMLADDRGDDAAGRGQDSEQQRLPRLLLRDALQGQSRAPGRRPTAGDPAYLLYTSGTSGEPKGVLVPHGALAHLAAAAAERYALSPADRMLQFSAWTFDVAAEELFATWCSGGCSVLPSANARGSFAAFDAFLEERRVTVVNLPASFWHGWVESLEGRPEAPAACLRLAVVGNEAVRPDHFATWRQRQRPDQRFLTAYGPTEATVTALVGEPGGTVREGLAALPLGRPLSGVSAWVMDRRLRLAASGVEGELCLGGDGLAQGYLARPGETALRFVPNPFEWGGRLYRTGDRTRYGPDGTVEFLGRQDRQLKLRGFRIEPAEIEAVLELHRQVTAAAVLAPQGQLVAFVEAGPEPLDEAELRARLGTRLPPYMVPERLIFLAPLPRTAGGKIDYARLASLARTADSRPAAAAALSDRERLLAQIWEEVLGVSGVGPTDDFFQLGGDSIRSLLVVDRARARGISLSPRQVLEARTVRRLAAAPGAEIEAAEQGPVVGSLPLTPMQRWFFEQRPGQPEHWNQAILLEVPAELHAAKLQTALDRLIHHHDALRLTFRQQEEGWRQEIALPGRPAFLAVLALGALPEPRRQEAFLPAADAVHRSFDLGHGPLLAALLVRGFDDDRGRLLLVAHHLAVDAVSWGILLEDLRAFLEPAPEAPEPPPKTTSFLHWSRRLTELGRETPPDLVYQAAGWLEEGAEPVLFPADFPGEGAGTVGGTEVLSFDLEGELSRWLLEDSARPFGNRPLEVQLCALAGALAEALAEPRAGEGRPQRLLIDLEAHGRDLPATGVDLSRTVGCFTAIVPVDLELQQGRDLSASLRQSQGPVRRALGLGQGYGVLKYLSQAAEGAAIRRREPAAISYNFLRTPEIPAGPLRLLDGATGSPESPWHQRSHLLDITAIADPDGLRLHWAFSPERLRRSTVEGLARRFAEQMRALRARCQQEAQGRWSFPASELSPRVLDQILPAVVARRGEPEDLYPLSPLQAGLVFHSDLDPEAAVYHQQLACRLRGPLRPAAFRVAWQRVFQRHGILRTALLRRPGEAPLQAVYGAVPLPWRETDWRSLTAPEQEIHWRLLLAEDAALPFSLEEPPLLRLTLVRCAEESFRFLFSHHHLLLDGWSTAILLKEVLALYEAFAAAGGQAQEPSLPEPLPFGEWVTWTRQLDPAPARRYWRLLLDGFREPTPLPVSAFEELGSQKIGAPFGSLQRRLSGPASERLQAVAAGSGITLSSLVQSAWALLLTRLSGAPEAVFGLTVAGRSCPLPAMEDRVGLFINTIPVRLAPAEDASLGAWLEELRRRQELLQGFEHSSLAEIRQLSQLPPEAPLFESLVVFENYPVAQALDRLAGGVRASDAEMLDRTHFPLTLSVLPGPPLALHLEYDAGRFDATALLRATALLERLLLAHGQPAETPLRCLGGLAPAERQQILVEWNDTPQTPEKHETPETSETAGDAFDLLEPIRRQVRQRPQATAVRDGALELSFEELWRRSGSVAAALLSRRLGPEAVVGLLAQRSAGQIAALLGILRAGATALPLDPDLPAERRRWLIEDAGAVLVLADPAAAGDDLSGVPTLPLEPDEAAPSELPSEPLPEPVPHPQTAAYVIYTSGSTGRPKGVVVCRRSLTHYVGDAVQAYSLTDSDRCLQFASLSFDASAEEIFPTLAAGACLELRDDAMLVSGAAFWQGCRQRAATVLNLPTSFWHRLVAELGDDSVPTAVRLVILGGEEARGSALATWRRWAPASVRLVNTYGPTEATIVATRWFAAGPHPERPPIGRPIGGVRAYVLNHRLEPVGLGAPGELFLAGAGLARCYGRRPARTAAAFLPDPFGPPGSRMYKSGDGARWRPDGELVFLGRADHQVKVRGFRIELGEVEAALDRHPQVAASAVSVSRRGGEASLFAAVATLSPALSGGDLVEHLRRTLPDPMIPATFHFLPSLPLTAQGKVDRSALAALGAETAPESGSGELRTPFEKLVAEVWQDVLGLDAVGSEDHFFALGGHSLLAAQAAGRLQDRLGTEVPLRAVFDHPTVAALAGFLEGGADDSSSPMPARAPSLEVPKAVGPKVTAIPRRPESQTGPQALAFNQERLWFLDQLEPGSDAYTIPLSANLRGPLALPAFARAVAWVEGRHEALRTAFPARDGAPEARLRPPSGPRLPVVDLSGLLPAPAQKELDGLAAAFHGLPFDLAAGPLFRKAVVRRGPKDHSVLLAFHHIIADGWSLSIFLREVEAAYEALRQGADPALPPVPLQFADIAAWQRQRFEAGAFEDSMRSWLGRLADPPPALELPTDRPRSSQRRYRSGHSQRRLSSELTGALRKLTQERRITPFMVLSAALSVVAARLSGQEDLCLGTAVAGRGRPELQGVVGFLVDTAVLRLRPRLDLPFEAFLDQVRDEALDALAERDVPFERLVRELDPERDLARSPLFQIFLNVLNFEDHRLQLADLEIEALELPEATAKFEWTLYAAEVDQRLHLDLVYDASLFDPERSELILEQVAMLLEEAVEFPQRPLGDLDLLPASFRRLLPDPEAPLPRPEEEALATVLERAARRRPEAVAVVAGERSWTLSQIRQRAEALAGTLSAAGIGKGDVVAVRSARRPTLPATLWGIARSGAAFALLDPLQPQDRLRRALALVKPAAWIDLDPPGPAAQEGELLALSSLRLSLTLADLDRGWPEAQAPPDTPPDPDGPLHILFTSGSSGEPKAVQAGGRGLVHFLAWSAATFEVGPEDRLALLGGLGHDPLLRDLFLPLCQGARLHVPEGIELWDGAALVVWLRDQAITLLHLSPALGELLADEAAGGARLPALRLAAFAGDRLPWRTVERFRGLAPRARLVNFYGATETPQAMAWQEVSPALEPAAGTVPLGRGIDGVQILVRRENGQLCGPGELGEIQIRARYLAMGYLGDEEDSRRRFQPDPFGAGPLDRIYRTGDFGRYRPDGAVEFAGRRDRQVQIRGYRVELGAVEAALLSQEGVHEALAAVEPEGGSLEAWVGVGASLGDSLGDQAVTSSALLAGLRRLLPPEALPSRLGRRPRLPRTQRGKVDLAELQRRDRLKHREGPETLSVEELGRFLTPTEEVLAGLWQELLPSARPGRDSNFFESGGHSLLATRLVARLRRSFGVELPVRTLFEQPTLQGLARRLEDLERAGRGLVLPPLVAAERSGDLPLSFAQERLWFLDQLEPGSSAYNIPLAVVLRGPLQVAAFEQALGGLVARHETLRTRFEARDGVPRQVVDAPSSPPLPVVDLSGLEGSLAELESLRLASVEARRRFALAAGPVLRVTLVRRAEAEHGMLATLHHIASDGWSMGLLLRDFAAFYQGAVTGSAPDLLTMPALPALPALPVQYADYALWQRSWLQGAALAQEVGYWRQRLEGLPPVLELPTDRPRPAVQSSRGGVVDFRWPAELEEGLERYSRQQGSTRFMTVLAAFEALLYRWTGQSSLAVGSPIAGRRHLEVEGLIGFFVNTLVLRAEVSDALPFAELVTQARERLLEAHAHQDIPFERIVEELRPERSLSHSPVFQVMLTVAETGSEAQSPWMPELTVEPWTVEATTSKFDLTLALSSGAERLGAMEYCRDLFDRTTVQRWSGHFLRLLTSALAEPGRPLGELPFLDPAELSQLLVEWATSGSGAGPASCLHELIAAQVARSPQATAVICHQDRQSYAALERQARRLAGRLQEVGVGPETRVGVLTGRGLELPSTLLGILQAGGAYVGLDPAYPPARLQVMLEDSGARVLVADRESLAKLATPLDLGDRSILLLEEVFQDEETAGPAPRPIRLDPENLAYLVYTSGSTGEPKGVAVPHRAACRLVRWSMAAFRPEELASVLASTSICFDISVFELFVPLAVGGRVVIVENVLALAEETELPSLSLINTVPSAMAELVSREALPPGLETVNLAGETLGGPLVESIYATGAVERVVNLYGPSEDTVYSTAGAVPRGQTVPTIGRPLWDTRGIVANGHLRLVAAGSSGELWLSGEGQSRGYLGRPGRTALSFVPDPFSERPGGRLYRTGDRVRWSRSGELEFLGRVDHQVKLRGFRIELGEIEAVLGAHGGVENAVVVMRQDEARGPYLVAYVVASPAPAQESDLRAHLAARLPQHMVPSAWEFLEQLPLTPSGKVDRRALPSPEPAGSWAAEFSPPRTPTEEVLAGLWSEVLGVPRISAQASFFELGGHSLMATRLVARLRRSFGVEMPVRGIFEAPTLRGLAAAVDRLRRLDKGEEMPPLTPRPPGTDSFPLSLSQEPFWLGQELANRQGGHHISAAVELRGSLNGVALARAWAALRQRHEALRSTFSLVDGEPCQRLTSPAALGLTWVDLRHLPGDLRQICASPIAARFAALPFDLGHGPLLRLLLCRLEDKRWNLQLTVHHLVTDGWSQGILLRDLVALYRAFADGRPDPLPPLPVQFGDFVLWQRQWLTGQRLGRLKAFWKEALANSSEVLNLPTDRPRRPQAQRRAGTRQTRFSPDLLARLQGLGRRHGATLFMVLRSLLAVLLHRLTHQSKLRLATPVAGRHQPELEEVVGCFVNTLILPSEVAPGDDFERLLARVRRQTLAAYDHQDLPLERLVSELPGASGRAGQSPFRLLFALQNVPAPAVELGDLSLRPLDPPTPAAICDLALQASESEDGLEISAVFDADLFDGTTILRWLRSWENLAKAATEGPFAVDAVSLASRAQRQQILVEWRGPEPIAGIASEDLLVPTMIARQAMSRPEAPALSHEGETLSYSQLLVKTRAVAGRLAAEGAGPEAVVAICLPRGPELVISALGALEAGAAFLLIDAELPTARIAWMIEDCVPCALVTSRELALTLPRLAIPLVDTAAMIEAPSVPRELPPPGLRAQNLAYGVYTSGSTGKPKAVAVSHGALANLLREHQRRGICQDTRYLFATAPGFDVAVLQILAPLAAGATLVVAPAGSRRQPSRLVALIEREGITRTILPPPMLATLLEVPELRRCSTLEVVEAGGSTLTAALAARFRQTLPAAQLWNCYGPAETAVEVTAGRVPTTAEPPSIGRPRAGATVDLLSPTLWPVPLAAPGEICLGGPGLARGYLRRPSATALAFVPDPQATKPGARLYRTGDLGRHRADGHLDFVGRRDHQVKIQGVRIELGEVEALLESLSGVAAAAAALVPGAAGNLLVAYVVARSPDPDADLANSVRREARERFPAAMVPARIHVLPELPRTATGKVDRRALPRLEKGMAPPPKIAPRTATEAKLKGLWGRVLGLEDLGVTDDFFELGGGSLMAVRLLAELRQDSGIDLSLRDLLETPSIESLARRLDQPAAAPRTQSPRVRIRQGSGRPLFWVHPGGGTILCYRDLARALPTERPLDAFEARGLRPGERPLETVEEMAELYLQALLEAQPQGPYFLGGWSFGGMVAFELAQRLRARGEEIEALVLADCGPAQAAAPAPAQAADGEDILALLQVDAEDRAAWGRLDGAADRLAWVLRLAHRRQLLPATYTLEDARRFQTLVITCAQAFRRYRPQPYGGPILLLRPEDGEGAALRPEDLGWLAHTPSVRTLWVPGDHATMLLGDHARATVARLEEALGTIFDSSRQAAPL